MAHTCTVRATGHDLRSTPAAGDLRTGRTAETRCCPQLDVRPPPAHHSHLRSEQGGDLNGSATPAETTSHAPWGFGRMAPLRNGSPSPWRYAGVDPATQTGRWIGEDGEMAPAELGKHGTSVNTYPPTQVGKGGKIDPDTGQGAEQD
ncbi:putative ATP-grasp-modified RiPP [Streptomyces alboflavus]|nr:putative ATP-grasp-modified RiPP [Streptomyces alboflavus]